MSVFYGTNPVGSVLTNENGVRLKVVPSPSCDGCYYNDDTEDCKGGELGECCADYRTDKTSVIFVEVKGGQQ